MSREHLSIIDRTPAENKEEPYKRKEKSSTQLIVALEAMTKIAVKELKIEGLEHLQEIPPDRMVVIAVSHASDLDLPLVASALCRHLDLIITNQSTQYKFLQDPGSNIGMKILGQDNFLPIDWQLRGSGKPRKFNPENYKPMVEAMQGGRSIIIAAHTPSHKGTIERSGYGAVYLSEIANAIVLPVGVDVEAEDKAEVGMSDHKIKTLLHRPSARVNIGKPFELQKIEGIERMAEITEKRKTGQPATEKELIEFTSLKDQLREQSKILIDSVADLMPLSKQAPE